jgi:hypothetical protein
MISGAGWGSLRCWGRDIGDVVKKIKKYLSGTLSDKRDVLEILTLGWEFFFKWHWVGPS